MFNLLDFCSLFAVDLGKGSGSLYRQIPGIPPAWQAALAFFRIVFSDTAYTSCRFPAPKSVL